MRNKMIIFILFLLIITIGVISSVSATDDIPTNDSSGVIGIADDLSEDNVETNDLSENEVEINELGMRDSGEDTLESSRGTFTDLQKIIDKTSDGGTITLDKDYYVDDGFEYMGYGVTFRKSLTIDGNGHTLDGLSKSKIFRTDSAKSVIIKNLILKNGFWDDMTNDYGVISVDSFQAINCSFINHRGNYFGGALMLAVVKNVLLKDCIFSNNTAYRGGGGAVFLQNVTKASFDGCSFNGNKAMYGGAIYSCMSGDFTLNTCDFDTNFAENGGDIALQKLNSLEVKSTNFMASYAYGRGGSFYLDRIPDVTFDSCYFFLNFALYGGVFRCEDVGINLKNLILFGSRAYGYGGIMDAIQSNISVDECSFSKFWSSTDAGGGIYNVEGSLVVRDSSFVGGYASKSGGAISSLRSDLTVIGSDFINNGAYAYGGAIYSMYGSLNVDSSFFNNSDSYDGTSIYTEMADSAVVTNNIFLNSTSISSCISVVSNKGEFIEHGNHFEDEYHFFLEYVGFLNNEKFTYRSNLINYILSNTGKYLNTYEDIDSSGDYRDDLSIKFWDYDNPDTSVVYKLYSDNLVQKYNLTKSHYFDDTFKNEEYLNYIVYNDQGNYVTRAEKPGMQSLLQLINTSSIMLMSKTIYQGSYSNEIILTAEVFSVINSTVSDIKSIPSYYNSNDYGYVTPVKHQEAGGNCWAFAGIATLETCLKKATGITYDFSEENVKNLMAAYSSIGLNMKTNKGGEDEMIMSYLTTWSGPITEDYENYHDTSLISSYFRTGLPIQNIKFLPQRKSSADNDIFKRAIMDYGAVAVTVYWYPSSGHHAFSIVGWDDNYNNYDSLGTYTKGAWIFKNSWGTDWGDEGYGYLSYGTKFSSDTHEVLNAYTFIFDKDDTYLKNYQMDYGGVSDYLYSDEHVFYSNKFTSGGSNEYLTAFSTYFKFPTDYKVSVYKKDSLVLSQSGHIDRGYYTIAFKEKILLGKYEEFKIVIENCNSGYNVFPVCQADELNNVNFKQGTSFFSYDGKEWFDLYDLEDYCEFLYGGTKKGTCQVACIKAFTTMYDDLLGIRLDVDKFDNIDVNQKVTVKLTLSDLGIYNFDVLRKVQDSLITFTIDNKEYYAMIKNNTAVLDVGFDSGGTHVFTAQYKNNLFESNIVKFTFKVNKQNAQVSASSVNKVYGGNEKSTITLKDDQGNSIKDAVVYFNVDGKSTKIITNSNGQATVPISLSPKNYVATVSFEGNGKYNSVSTQVNVAVKKATPKITASKATFKSKVKSKAYTVTLKDTQGKVMKNAKLTISVKGKTYKATTNKNGKATFKITKLTKIGTFKATIKYKSTGCYNAASKTVKITVKK